MGLHAWADASAGLDVRLLLRLLVRLLVRRAGRARLIVLLVCVPGAGEALGQSRVIDDGGDAGAWSLILADGVKGEIVEVDGALRLDYDFSAGSGYCVLHKQVDLALDPNYRFGFRFKGDGPPNTLEFKLIDGSGENVWWSVERDFAFPEAWTTRSMRRRHFSFAWGPGGGKARGRLGAIEIAVTAARGGMGSVWIDDLVYERLPDIEPEPSRPRAVTGDGAALGRVEENGAIEWTTRDGGRLELLFDALVEFSGVELVWSDSGAPAEYRLGVSRGGDAFETIATVVDSGGGTDVVFAPETEARAVRLVVPGGGGKLEAIRFLPVERLTSANDYFALLASRARRGAYPRYFGALSPWTVIGLPGRDEEALVSATGAIEPVKKGYSIEPFIVRSGRVSTWADARLDQTLEDGSLPIPSVRWTLDGLTLDITALATDGRGGDRVLARYRLTNTSDRAQRVTLALAGRPLQVLPAAQFLNTVGGAVRAESLGVDPTAIRVGGSLLAAAQRPAQAVLTADASGGALIDRLADRRLDDAHRSSDGRSEEGAFPSAALLYDLELAPGDSESVVLAMPMNGNGARDEESGLGLADLADLFDFASAMGRERSRWAALLGRTDILVPDAAAGLRETIRANLAYILVNADGPGIQPGSRSYERSWIRDGAMTSAALIAMGHQEDARAFIEWYSGFQYPDGKVPCVVDARGADPVDENDAPGEFLFAIRNSALAGGRAGGGFDESFARAMYPRVRSAVGYIEKMRATRLTPGFVGSDDPIRRASAGLMPESISHEGYSAKPMHSYWDDFWVYRGLLDATDLAARLGERADEARFAALAGAMGESLGASVERAAAIHGIDYVPGCVELGDFDATSTSIASYPTTAAAVLDPERLGRTFERAWEATQDRISGGDWDGMTPYEVRLVGTFVRLGWVDRAHAYLDWLMDRRDPAGWRQWGEIAYRAEAPCRFVGDMPHTWVGSGAILSILSMFAYEQGDALVLGAGVRAGWLDGEEPIGTRGLVTRFGVLGYAMRRHGGLLEVEIEPGCAPPGGYRIDAARLLPGSGAIRIEIDGRPVGADAHGPVLAPPTARRVRVRRDG